MLIPMALLTGFLGSGKTTLVRRLAEQHANRRVTYLVNEFSAVDVDGRLLAIPDRAVVTIAGGSIFCRCLVTEFIATLRRIADRRDDAGTLDGVIVEASGLADPRVIRQMLTETRLDKEFELRRIVAVIDPGSFCDLLDTLPSITAQIEAADVVLVNKVDLYDEDDIAAAEAAVQRIQAGVQMIRTEHCAASLDVFESAAQRRLVGHDAPCADPDYSTFAVPVRTPLNLATFLTALNAVSDAAYRIKGFVPTPTGTVYIDVSPSGVAATPAGRETTTELAIIGRTAARDQLVAFVEALLDDAYVAPPTSTADT